MKTRRFALLSAVVVVMLLATFLPLASFGTALAATGLQNPGFESGLTNWTPIKASDKVVVVGTEGPAQFAAYKDMGNVTVSPYRGSKMLRLGSPKRLAESQSIGPNTVSQTFTADIDTLLFAFRVFSWEFRGQDQFSFDLKDASGQSVGAVTALDGSSPLLVPVPGSTALNLSTFPRTWPIQLGKRGLYLNTGWVPVRITGLTVGGSYTLTFSAGGTKDNGHATWAYFDSANSPPVAKFSFGPSKPYEGDIVQLMDGSYDPDPGDRIVSWDWDVKWIDPEGKEWHSVSEARNPFFVPPDEQTSYSVRLTVADTQGESTTITNGQVPLDGYLYYPASDPPKDPFEPTDHKIPLLTVENAAPLVNALNIEAIPGQAITLVGRFLDPGWTDNHTANWTVSGPVSLGTKTLLEDDSAFLESGIATCQVTVNGNADPGNYAGTLTITDNDGASSSDNFTIHVVPDLPGSREPDDDIPLAESSQVPGDGIYLSYIQSAGDIDLFEVTLPTGQPLTAGSEVLVTLKGLPADYDLVMFSQSAYDAGTFQDSPFQENSFQVSPFTRSPFTRSPFTMAPFTRSPFTRSPFTRSPFTRSPFTRSPFTRSPFTRSPFTRSSFSQYPLSETGYTDLDAAHIGGTDISLAELGLDLLPASLTPVGFSANRGLEDEALLVRSELDGTRFYIAVAGANEAFSSTPYQLQVETSLPLDLADWLGDEGFTYNAPVDNWDNSGLYADNLTPAVISDNSTPLTLFVTQRERMKGLYGDALWNSLVSSLTDLAGETAIQGKIISVPIGMYEDADNNADEIAALNTVAQTIRAIIADQISQNPTIQYVVIVGSDDIVPSYRVPDETVISNERDYLLSSFVTPGSPLFYSLLGGWNLTDDYYVDLDPLIPWQGRVLYLPDLAIGRMVETPEEIMAAAGAFAASGGVLDPGTALVTGYDFFSDGSTALAGILGAAPGSTLISDTWTADDLRSELLSGGYKISAINAHFAHYAALSAFGFTQDITDLLTSEEVAAAGGDPLMSSLVMTMGCHAGLNVTDEYSDPADPGLGVNPALDFPQAMAQQRALFVASTGYGLGDDEGIGGTERLINIYADSLINDGVTVGQSLVLAKQRYLGSLSTMTVYDEKSSIQFTLYGLPQYQVGATAQSATSSVVSPLSQIASASLTSPSNNVTLDNIVFQRVDTASGSYFTVNGDAQATAFRPIQPRIVLPIASSDQGPVHGVLLQGGLYESLAPFDPVITRPTNEWEADVSELQIALPALWPAALASANTIETAGGAIEHLVIIPGQFQPTGFSDGEVIGVQRLYTDLDFELLRSTSADYEPPVVHGIDLSLSGGVINIGVAASDDQSGIARIVVLVFRNGEVIPAELVVSGLPQSGYFTVAVPGTAADRMVVQVADGAGNVTTATGKGAYLHAINAAIQPDQCGSTGNTVSITAIIRDFASLTAPAFYAVSFGDGTSESGMLPADADHFEIKPNGDAVFVIEHTYASFSQGYTVRLKVTDSSGGIGVSQVTLLLDPSGDANSVAGPLPDADLVGGYVSNNGTTMTIGLRLDGDANFDYQYRVTLNKQGTTALLKYNGGKVMGLPSLSAERVWNEEENSWELRFSFNLADLALKAGDLVAVVFETQSGVPGTGSTGFVDRMPDSGSFFYIIQ